MVIKKKEEPQLEEITEGEYRILMEGAIDASYQEAKEYIGQLNGIESARRNGYAVHFYKQGTHVLYQLVKKPRIGF